MAFTNPITGGQGALVRPAIKSPNYVPGVSGWSIKRDGTAEFSDVTVHSSDGSGNTVVLQNGHIQIFVGGVLVAEGTPDNGHGVAGWLSYATQFGVDYYSALTAAGVDVATIGQAIPGGFTYSDLGGGRKELFIDSGHETGRDSSLISLVSESAAGAKDRLLVLDSDQIQLNGLTVPRFMRSGRAQTPAPGGVPAQTSVPVTFGVTFPSVPRVQITPNSAAANLNTTNLRWAVSSVTVSGFTINCWRDSNAATNFDWWAVPDNP